MTLGLCSSELPFLAATMCARDSLIFVACNDAMLLLEVEVNGNSHCTIHSIRSSTAPRESTMFNLITFSTFNADGSLIALTNRSQVSLIRTDTLDLQFIDTSAPNRLEHVALVEFGARYLFTVLRTGHLLAFELGSLVSSRGEDEGDATDEIQVSLRKDAGIVSASRVVTAMIADERNAQLIVCLSDATIVIYSTGEEKTPGFLAVLHTINLMSFKDVKEKMLMDVENVLPTVHSGSLSGSGSYGVLGTNVGLLALHRGGYQVELVMPFDSVTSLTAISTNGSACSYFPFSQALVQIILGSPLDDNSSDSEGEAGERNILPDGTWSNEDMLHAMSLLKFSKPLRASEKEAQVPVKLGAKTRTATPLGGGNLKSKPVTFGKAIKSSGYTSAQPWSVQQAAKAKAKAKAKSSLAGHTTASPILRYDCSCGPTVAELKKSSALLASKKVHTGAINAIEFDAQGNHLATASTDATGNLLKLPCVKFNGDGYALRGHKGQITSIDLSLHLQNPLVACGSFDQHFSIWAPTKGRELPYVMFDTKRDVKVVRFFYMDQLLAVASGSSIALYTYSLDEGGGDLERKRNDSVVEKVLAIATDAQSVVAFDGYNAFLSNTIVWAGSNKQIGIQDVVQNVTVRSYEEAHARCIHSVEVMHNCRYSSPSMDALHTFATASLDQTVKLWDMRTKQGAIRTFAAHKNSAVKTGLALSPCGRFLVSGSESRNAYLYDRGSGAVIEKLSMNDTVGAVRYHPTQPLLAVGSNSGQLKFFGEAKKAEQ